MNEAVAKANEYTTRLAKILQRLKKDLGAEYVRQNYKGTGSKVFRRQIFVRWDSGKAAVDLWLDSVGVRIGGVYSTPEHVKIREVAYGEKTPEQVYVGVLAALKGETPSA